MSTFPHWKAQRVIDFLNRAQDATTIAESTLLKDIGGEGYVIGQTVAARIIEHREALRFRRFSSLEEVLAVPGLGEDKLQDLVHSLAIPADRYFIMRLFDGLLLDNWEVRPLSKEYTNDELFAHTANSAIHLKAVAAQLLAGDYTPFGDDEQRYTHLAIRQAYIERLSEAHLASYQLAYWFYLFDQDNWFSFERMREVCEAYLSYHSSPEDYLELWLIKNHNQLPEDTLSYRNILPMVVNHGERKVTLWQAQLFD